MVKKLLFGATFLVALGVCGSPLAQDCVNPQCYLCYCAVDGTCSEIDHWWTWCSQDR